MVWRVAPAVEQTRAPAWLVGNLVHEAIAAWRLPVDGELAAWVRARSRTYGLGDEARAGAALERFETRWSEADRDDELLMPVFERAASLREALEP